jgi:hypothetical protein
MDEAWHVDARADWIAAGCANDDPAKEELIERPETVVSTHARNTAIDRIMLNFVAKHHVTT